ncbi:hypothetical protein BOX15_Mlig022655g1 [Macrostomum lignano]|uniref:XRCC4 domain-containing protein n=1 Tax=Macrostomum lignano TaxID=282301 RepID=A0A267H454_9PLAT|nr:hypothetical protein BOX15_Mlig022655g1 [Macrostomum lignano]
MNNTIVAIKLEDSEPGFILLSASKNSITGWKIEGSHVSLLKVSSAFSDGIDFFATLKHVQQDKQLFFARINSANKSVSICKNVDDIVIKVIQFDIIEINNEKLTSEDFMPIFNVALSLESHLAAAQAALASQSAELADLHQRNEQLLAKYTGTAAEKAAIRDNLLTAFSRVLNSKKERIRQLVDKDPVDRSESDEVGDGDAANSEGGGDIKRGGNIKRKVPTTKKAATSKKTKPAVRRTRSGAKSAAAEEDSGSEEF